MSGPLSIPNSVVYEDDSPPRNKRKRRLSPIQESPEMRRRVTRSQVSHQWTLEKRSGVQKIASKLRGEELVSFFKLKFAANFR